MWNTFFTIFFGNQIYTDRSKNSKVNNNTSLCAWLRPLRVNWPSVNFFLYFFSHLNLRSPVTWKRNKKNDGIKNYFKLSSMHLSLVSSRFIFRTFRIRFTTVVTWPGVKIKTRETANRMSYVAINNHIAN